MGMNQDPRGDAYGRSPERPDAPAPAGRAPQGSRGKITTRPSRESILQSYATQDEMRARDARLRSQQASRAYTASAAQRDADRAARREALAAQQREQEARRAAQQRPAPAATPAQRAGQRRTRVVPPLSSQESYDLTRSSMESYERARASRDALSEARRGRALNREVIDGRGSIDSRTFNESHQISAYSRDDRDRHAPMIDTMDNRTWYSRAGQGFATPAEGAPGAPAPVRRPRSSRASDVGFAGVMSGSANYGGAQGGSGVPLFVKVAVPLIVVLLVVIVCLLVF